MRKLCLMVLSALVVAGTIVAITATVSDPKGDSSGDDITSVTVTRSLTQPPTYTIMLCVDAPCPTTGEFIVEIGGSKVYIKKSAGGWGWRVKDDGGDWLGSGYASGNWENNGDGCCFTISGLTSSQLGNPEESKPNTPSAGQTTYTVTFSASGNGDSTSGGSLSWVET